MSRHCHQAIGLAFVCAVILNLNILVAQAEKGPRPKRATKMAEKQSRPLNALTFAALMQQAQHGDQGAQRRVGIAFFRGEVVELNPSEASAVPPGYRPHMIRICPELRRFLRLRWLQACPQSEVHGGWLTLASLSASQMNIISVP